jgi:acid phosphatase (class A)
MPAQFVALLVALVLAVAPTSTRAQSQPFVTASDVVLTKLLAPPPEPDSREAKAELSRLLSLQVTRTPEMEAQALADGVQDVSRFADVVGPVLADGSLPKLRALFARIGATEEAVTDPAKTVWSRPRPFQTSDLVRPVGRVSQSGSYPSGHATVGALMGIVLADMVPERRAAIMRRAWAYGSSRLVTGNHFPSDVEAGRMAGTAIAAVLATRDDYRKGFEEAKAELRAALDLPPQP